MGTTSGVYRHHPPAERAVEQPRPRRPERTTDEALAQYREARSAAARPGLPPEDAAATLQPAREALATAVHAELDQPSGSLTPANLDARAQLILDRHADDPAAQGDLRSTIEGLRTELEVAEDRSGAQAETDAALQDYATAQLNAASPGLLPEDANAILQGPRDALDTAVRDQLDLLANGDASADIALSSQNIGPAATEVLAQYADDPVAQTALRDAITRIRGDVAFEEQRERVLAADDPATVPGLLTEALALVPRNVQGRLLADPDVVARLDEAAARISAPLDRFDELDYTAPEVRSDIEETVAALEQATAGQDPRVAAALTERTLDHLDSALAGLQERGQLPPEEMGLLTRPALSSFAAISDHLLGRPEASALIERMATATIAHYHGDSGGSAGVGALEIDAYSALSVPGRGASLFDEISNQLAAAGEYAAATQVRTAWLEGLHNYVAEDGGGLNQAVDAYLDHTAELNWLTQNLGPSLTPQQLEREIQAYIDAQGEDWEADLLQLETGLSAHGANLLEQIEQLASLPTSTRETFGVDATITSLVEDPAAQAAISIVAGRHPELLLDVDLPAMINLLADIGTPITVTQTLANAHVQGVVLREFGQLNPNDAQSVARVRSAIDGMRGSDFANAWGISETQLDAALDALEDTIPSAGSTTQRAADALADYDRRLSGIEGFAPDTPRGQAFRSLAFGLNVVGLAASGDAFVRDPSFLGGAELLAGSVGLAADVGTLGQGLNWISPNNPLARLGANSSVTQLLGRVGIAFGAIGVLQELGEGDLAQAGLGAAAVGGTALAIWGSASWAGPVGWGVAAVATIGSFGLESWRRIDASNEYMTGTSADFLSEAGFTEDAARTLVDQSGEGISPVPLLFEFGRMQGMSREQTVAWLNDLQAAGTLDNVRNHVHGVLDDINGDLHEFTLEEAAHLQAWLADEVDTPLPVDTAIEFASPGENEVGWSFDAEGRPIMAEATLTEIPGFPSDRPSSEGNAQDAARERGAIGDHGGHVVAYQFVGAQGARNLFPQAGNFNVGAYKRLENEWADWTRHGMEVQLEVTLLPPGQDRPDEVLVSYRVVDPGAGEDAPPVYTNSVVFENQAGETFSRITYDDMPRYYG